MPLKKTNRNASPAESGKPGQPLPRGAGRPPVRRNEIFDEIRTRIAEGKFRPGGRIWTLREICRRFQASPATAHSVLQDLNAAGFIYSRGSRGTFVHDNPPFLHRYAVICYEQGPHEELYFQAIRQEAMRLQEAGTNIDLVELPRAPFRTGTVFELENRVARKLYRGLIFSRTPDHLLGTAILEIPGIERVSLSSVRSDLHSNIQELPVWPIGYWFERALERVLTTGRRRVGLFSHAWNDDKIQKFNHLITTLGLQTQRIWTHGLHHSGQEEAARIVELLFSLSPVKRPDILLIDNDNLTERVTHSLKECGIKIPVISHCNFPLLPKTHVPVTWLGQDISNLLAQSIRLVEKKNTDPLPRMLCFEEELCNQSKPIHLT